MYDLIKDAENAIPFVLMDTNGTEVTGLGETFTVTVRKNGGTFGASAGGKAELGSGWYVYTATNVECDTAGPLALMITAPGAAQQNLVYRVGSALTKEDVRAEIDANSTRLAAIQLVTDAIDVSEVTLAPVNVLGHLTITAALTFETPITGLVVPSDWTSAVWTLKRSRRDLDTASIIKLVESNPGAGTDGVTALNGAAPVSPLTTEAGALTIDAGAGTAGIRLTDDLTALLAVRPGLIWGLKFLRSNGDSKEYSGTADIDLSVVHGV